MPFLRLIADDLTGALDTAAELAGLCGPIAVMWNNEPADAPSCLAIDTGTRELPASDAVATIVKLAPFLKGADIAFKKVDSLLRGPWAAELAACFSLGLWRHCIVAPAFPHQGRRTLDGRQWARSDGGPWRDVGGDLAASLRAEGAPASAGRIAEGLRDGITIFDAATDADLLEIASLAAQAQGPILWCGTGGLARALASGHHIKPSHTLQKPVLGFFGSDQGVTRVQIEACRPHRMTINGESDVEEINRRLASSGVAFLNIGLLSNMTRPEAAARIMSAFGEVASGLQKPRTLIVAGGETLRAVCLSLGATSLDVVGQVEPGVPRSVMRGGRWDGIEVISKSGAFGEKNLWRDLLIENGLMNEEPD